MARDQRGRVQALPRMVPFVKHAAHEIGAAYILDGETIWAGPMPLPKIGHIVAFLERLGVRLTVIGTDVLIGAPPAIGPHAATVMGAAVPANRAKFLGLLRLSREFLDSLGMEGGTR